MSAYEDIEVGAALDIGAYEFTAERIKAFAAAFDPQPFHLDEAAAAESLYGRLCASGWHVGSAMMKLTVAAFQSAIDAGGDSILGGPSPGFNDLKWLKPVYAGDTVRFVKSTTGKRLSNSRPGWGIVTFLTEGFNQDGTKVFEVTSHVLARCREPVA